MVMPSTVTLRQFSKTIDRRGASAPVASRMPRPQIRTPSAFRQWMVPRTTAPRSMKRFLPSGVPDGPRSGQVRRRNNGRRDCPQQAGSCRGDRRRGRAVSSREPRGNSCPAPVGNAPCFWKPPPGHLSAAAKGRCRWRNTPRATSPGRHWSHRFPRRRSRPFLHPGPRSAVRPR